MLSKSAFHFLFWKTVEFSVLLTQSPRDMYVSSSSPRQKKEKIPDYLIHEVIDGKPYYRKGYRQVLNKTKTLEEIMGSSSLQFIVVDYLLGIIYSFIDRSKYYVATNEAGLYLRKKQNVANDIAIYSKALLTPAKISNKYADVPPRLVIEIDTKTETEDEAVGIHVKTQKLLDFGVERVIWIFTDSRKVLVAAPGQDWVIKDWSKDVELMEGHWFNIAAYLEQEGIRLSES